MSTAGGNVCNDCIGAPACATSCARAEPSQDTASDALLSAAALNPLDEQDFADTRAMSILRVLAGLD